MGYIKEWPFFVPDEEEPTKYLTPSKVIRKIARLNDKISLLRAEIKVIQDDLCGHVNHTKKYDGNSGNYDPSADSYWIDWECKDCGKMMTTPQGFPYTQSNVFPDKIKSK